MDPISNIALILQAIDSAEKNIQSAKNLLKDLVGAPTAKTDLENLSQKAVSLNVSEGGKVIEGVFDGQNMIGPDKKQYPVPANYASKSKLIEGDVLKLTISDDGSFIYKQIGPVDRKKMLGILITDDKGDFRVMAEGKPYKVLLASLTYFKSEVGDEVTIIVPEDMPSDWAAVENVIKKNGSSVTTDMEMSSVRKTKLDEDEEM
ncbi:MAG: hypothetical protein JNN11_02505 [Candidatus Doudnabacteria bacterium]|nr:hypothetical protein [Candidatus Doudnabacteria bacterium]